MGVEFLRNYFENKEVVDVSRFEKEWGVKFNDLEVLRERVYPLMLQKTASFDFENGNLEVIETDDEENEQIHRIPITDRNKLEFIVGLQKEADEQIKKGRN
jgi:hypothetical protein